MVRVLKVPDRVLLYFLTNHRLGLNSGHYDALRALAEGRAFIPPGVQDSSLAKRFEELTEHPESGAAAFAAEAGDEDDDCPICFHTFDTGAAVARCPCCRKAFDRSCVERWFQYGQSCPLCRSTVWEEYGKTAAAQNGYIQL